MCGVLTGLRVSRVGEDVARGAISSRGQWRGAAGRAAARRGGLAVGAGSRSTRVRGSRCSRRCGSGGGGRGGGRARCPAGPAPTAQAPDASPAGPAPARSARMWVTCGRHLPIPGSQRQSEPARAAAAAAAATAAAAESSSRRPRHVSRPPAPAPGLSACAGRRPWEPLRGSPGVRPAPRG